MIRVASKPNQQQIPPHVLLMLIAVQTTVLLPHSFRIPIWLTLLTAMCAIWRWFIYSKNWNYPTVWLKAALALGGGVLIISHYGVKHSLDIWCALLLLSFALKIIETIYIRDAYAVVFLAYFVLCVSFIFDQSMLLAGYQFASVIVITAAMICVNLRHKDVPVIHYLKLSAKLTLHAIPLMLILFVVFPRITPFWTVPRPSAATTGLSTEMTPGDIAQLTKSDEIVFRAVFEGQPPPTQDLYWRGLVYSDFNLGRWSKAPIPALLHEQEWISWSNQRQRSAFVPELSGQEKITYQVLMEPSHQVWQFGLDLAIPQPTSNGLSWDFRLVSRKPVHTVTRYAVDSYPFATLDATLPEWSRRRELRLPANDNPRIIAYAKELYRNASSDQNYITTLLNEISRSPFRYTLKPPTLNHVNSIDQFWFDTRSGFCTHYAGALVVLLRVAGIPARMVGGYQGGEINPVTGHVVVRQYHAHAWVEAWLPESGWQRIDPTVAVAPQRVETGLDAALQEDERASLSIFTHARLGNTFGLTKVMHWIESVEHRWNMLVVGYDGKQQIAFLTRLLGAVTAPKIALLVLIGIGTSLLFAGMSLLKWADGSKPDPLIAALNRFTVSARKLGYQRTAKESYPAFLHRIGRTQTKNQSSIERIARQTEQLLYQPPEKVSSQQINDFKKELQKLTHGLQSFYGETRKFAQPPP